MAEFVRPPKQKNRNVSRIDSPGINLHGWQVRVQRQGKQYSKFFPDREYEGSWEDALEAAKVYRDDLVKKLPASGSDPTAAAMARNKSGVRGLWVASKGAGALYVQVGLRDDAGKLHSKSFSITKLGASKALMRAAEALHEIQKELNQPVEDPQEMHDKALPYVEKRIDRAKRRRHYY
jgi:hypothetical protein